MQDAEASQIPSGLASTPQVEDEEGEDDEGQEESDRSQPSRWSVSSLGDASEVDRSVDRQFGEDVTVQVGDAVRVFCRSEDAWFDGQVTAVHALGRVSVEFEVGDGIRRKTLSLTSAKLFVEPGLPETDPGKPLARAQIPDEQRHRVQRAEEAAEQRRLRQAAAQRRQQATAAERRRLQQNLADKQRRLVAAAERRVKLAREATVQRRQQETPERRLQQQVPNEQRRLAAVAEEERRRVQLARQAAEQRRLQEQRRPQPEAPAEQPRARQSNVQSRQYILQQTKDMKRCDSCLDYIMKSSDWVTCPTMAHFFCNVCLLDLLRAFKTVGYAVQKKVKGRILCPMKESEAPFGDAALAAHVPPEVFNEYLEVRIIVAKADFRGKMIKENYIKLEELKKKLAEVVTVATGVQREVDAHRLQILDDIFTLKCPRCKLAFLDFDGCSALTCGGCACAFCSYCLKDCGADAHEHLRGGCEEGGPMFCPFEEWLVHQRKRKTKIMGHCLASVPQAFLLHDKLLSIMSELSLQALRQKICDSVAREARDLGITMP